MAQSKTAYFSHVVIQTLHDYAIRKKQVPQRSANAVENSLRALTKVRCGCIKSSVGEYCATMGRVGAAHRDREEILIFRSWKISRGEALKTTPERVPKP